MKKKITENIGEQQSFDADNSIAIPVLLNWLKEAIDSGATHVSWYARTDYDGMSEEVEIRALLIREETDQEYRERTAAEQQRATEYKIQQFRSAQNEYERLKKIFEPDQDKSK